MLSARWLLQKNRHRRAAEDLGLDDPFVTPNAGFTSNGSILRPGYYPDRGGPTGVNRGNLGSVNPAKGALIHGKITANLLKV